MNNPKNASKKIDKFVEHYVIENFENIIDLEDILNISFKIVLFPM